MFTNEIPKVPLEPVSVTTTCAHHQPELTDPTAPPDEWHSVSPFVSVMVMIVLLNVLCTCAMPRLTLRRAFFFLLFAIGSVSASVSVSQKPAE